MVNEISHIIEAAKPYIKEQERDLPKIRQAYDLCEQNLSADEVQAVLNQAEIAITMIGLGAKALMAIFLKPCFDKEITDAINFECLVQSKQTADVANSDKEVEHCSES